MIGITSCCSGSNCTDRSRESPSKCPLIAVNESNSFLLLPAPKQTHRDIFKRYLSYLLISIRKICSTNIMMDLPRDNDVGIK